MACGVTSGLGLVASRAIWATETSPPRGSAGVPSRAALSMAAPLGGVLRPEDFPRKACAFLSAVRLTGGILWSGQALAEPEAITLLDFRIPLVANNLSLSAVLRDSRQGVSRTAGFPPVDHWLGGSHDRTAAHGR